MTGGGHEYETIVVSTHDGVARVQLNRPERRNAISIAMRAELKEAFAALDRDDDVNVVVLTGTGTAFCAGVDLSEGAAGGHLLDPGVRRVSEPLDGFAKPVIAAINGAAIGGGLELALAADIRVAAASSLFSLPEVKLGSLPGSGGTQRLPRFVPPAVAARLILTGEMIDAREAHRIGLVSDLYEDSEFAGEVEALAATIAANAPLSLRAAKLALRAALQESAGFDLERQLWALLATTADRAEGRSAFREGRPPRFSGN